MMIPKFNLDLNLGSFKIIVDDVGTQGTRYPLIDGRFFLGNLLPIASRHFVEDFSATLTPEGNVPLLSHYIPIHIPITCCVNRFIPTIFPLYHNHSHQIPMIIPSYTHYTPIISQCWNIRWLYIHDIPIKHPLLPYKNPMPIPIAPARRIPAPLPAQVPRPREDIMGIDRSIE